MKSRKIRLDLVVAAGVCRAALALLLWGNAAAQDNAEPEATKDAAPETLVAPLAEELTPAAQKVDINPTARDDEIRQRLLKVLVATAWFTQPQVEVEEGVVFLSGWAKSAELKKWAGDLARNTQDVVAVANRIEVTEPDLWDLSPAWQGLWSLWRESVRSLPFFVFGMFVLGLSVVGGILVTRTTRSVLQHRIRARLLLNVVSRSAGVFLFLIGTYVVLRVSGLTQLALSVVGGTGLIGLALGIAFRDITENFLASIFLSLQKPFETGDFVEVANVKGFVQQLNIRTTLLMTLEGHLVQVPNASVYKSNLRNYSTNPQCREDFTIGIGYDDPIDQAQETSRKILADHPAVLKDPEPLVLVDNLGTSTVNLRLYVWFNSREHSNVKVRSSLIRLVKAALQKQGISLPDESREVVFPRGIPAITLLRMNADEDAPEATSRTTGDRSRGDQADEVSTKAEAGLLSQEPELKKQARQVQPLNKEENLLSNHNGTADE